MADDVGPFRTEAKLQARTGRDRSASQRALGARPLGVGARVRPAPARLVRSAQHAAGGARGRRAGARAHRKPRRASARGLSRACCREWCVNQVRRASGGSRAGAPPRRAVRRRAMAREGHAANLARRARRRGRASKTSRCRSSPASRCSTACAGSASTNDPTLAIRFSCINANACKECMMEIRRQDGLCLHRAAEGRRDDARAACRTRRWCATWSPRSRRRDERLLR